MSDKAVKKNNSRSNTEKSLNKKYLNVLKGISKLRFLKSLKKSITFWLNDLKTNRRKKNTYIFVFILILLFIIVYLKINLFIAATVNNEPIFRWQLIKELELRGGEQTLDSMITEKLILQEAKNNSIVISQEDIDKEIEKVNEQLKAQNMDLDSALAFQGQTKDDFIKNLRLRLMVEKLIQDKTLCKEMGISGQKLARTEFGSQKMANRFTSFYQEIFCSQ